MTNDQFDVIEALYLRDEQDGSFRRALDHAYRAGIEAAAKMTEQYVAGSRYGERAGYLSLLDRIRALSQPPPHDGSAEVTP